MEVELFFHPNHLQEDLEKTKQKKRDDDMIHALGIPKQNEKREMKLRRFGELRSPVFQKIYVFGKYVHVV